MIKYKLINYCEFDKYAAKAFSLIHNEPEEKNLGDITKVNEKELEDFNVMSWGFCCQDVSGAGKQKGIKLGCDSCKHEFMIHEVDDYICPKCNSDSIIAVTRSGLYYNGYKILKENKPNISIIENVKGLTTKPFKLTLEKILKDLDKAGYNNYWKVLNAKDYGIPQNRERVFIISIRKDLDNGKFEFPTGFDNGIRLKDLLEDKVDERYYISQEKVEKLIQQLKDKAPEKYMEYSNAITSNYKNGCATDEIKKHKRQVVIEDEKDNKILQLGMLDIKSNEQARRVYDPEGLCPTLNTIQGGNRQPKVLEENNTNQCNELINMNPSGEGMSGRVYDSAYISPTLDSSIKKVLDINYRIRKLTPLECFRVMGFSDEDYYILEQNKISNTQIYKMAGNSIVTTVLYYILLEIHKAMPYLLEDIKLSSFFSGIGSFEKAIVVLQEDVNKNSLNKSII